MVSARPATGASWRCRCSGRARSSGRACAFPPLAPCSLPITPGRVFWSRKRSDEADPVFLVAALVLGRVSFEAVFAAVVSPGPALRLARTAVLELVTVPHDAEAGCAVG